MNKATLIGVWPSDEREDDEYNECNDAIIDRVLDTMGCDMTAILADHALGRISDEAFELLSDYLSKYDGMLRDEV